jgi:hypothetical protein
MSKPLALMLLLASLSAAQAQSFMTGNDIGGIISWSPEAEAVAVPTAQAHCAYYGKQARIISVYRQYGHYIGFECAFPRGYVVQERLRALRVRG